jgi:hypothetical protein
MVLGLLASRIVGYWAHGHPNSVLRI